MEERKLNFNAPFLSVRRYSKASSSSSVEEAKRKPENSTFGSGTEFCFDQVTEPVAVPFHWEFIPGRSKNGDDEPESKLPLQPDTTPITSRFLQNSAGDYERENSLGNEGESEDSYNKYESSSDSLSRHNCSVSGLSGSDGPDLKPCGTFSLNPETLAFIMNRFLPAAKAMAINTGNYASRKQLTAVELPENPRNQNCKPSIEQIQSAMIKQDEEIKEKEEGDVKHDERQDSCDALTNSGCLIRGLCQENSRTGLLNPLLPPTTLSLVYEVQKLGREKSYVRSQSPNLKKFCYDQKLEEGGSPRLPEFKNLNCDLKTRGRLSPFRHSRGASPYRIENPQLFEVPNANRLVLQRKSLANFDCELVSGERNSDSGRPEIEKTLSVDSENTSASNLNFSDLKKAVKFTSDKIETRTRIEEQKKTPTVESRVVANPEYPNVGESIPPELPNSITNEQKEQESKSLECSKSRNEDNQKPGEAQDEIDYNSISRPPPLPKSPAQSWLWRTLPSISSENLSSRSNFGNRARSKKQNLKPSSTEPSKWETIVKTSNRHNDHVRYSEELVSRVYEHTKS